MIDDSEPWCLRSWNLSCFGEMRVENVAAIEFMIPAFIDLRCGKARTFSDIVMTQNRSKHRLTGASSLNLEEISRAMRLEISLMRSVMHLCEDYLGHRSSNSRNWKVYP